MTQEDVKGSLTDVHPLYIYLVVPSGSGTRLRTMRLFGGLINRL